MALPLDRYTQTQLTKHSGYTGPLHPQYPPIAGWTAVNSSGQTIAGKRRGILWDQTAVGSANLIGYTRPVSGNITLQAFIEIETTNGSFSGVGLAFESASGQIVIVYMRNGGFAIENWNSPTSFSSGSTASGTYLEETFWMQAVDNGTNIVFSVSPTGLDGTWNQIHSQGRTAFLTGGPSSVGWWGRDNNATQAWLLRAWREV